MEYDNAYYGSAEDELQYYQQPAQYPQQHQGQPQQQQQQQQQPSAKKLAKQNNALPLWGNENSMNLNPLILANIQGSSYFKVSLFKLKTYHEVVDEIYYQVKHLEPWERGSRKTAGQTGMCGGVRGVGAGGIVSTAFCLLYKLYTLRLTRKQVNGLLTHGDSPYIRALGFMYLRFTQPPGDLFDWYEPYLLDEEEIDVKAGGGQTITIGQMIRQWLTKLDWFSTLFPRIPVPIQKQIDSKLEQFARENGVSFTEAVPERYNKAGRGSYAGASNAPGSGGGGGPRAAVEDREPPRHDYPKEKKRDEFAGHCDRDREPPPRTSRYDQQRQNDDRWERERDRERDRERERDRDRDRDRDRGKERERERDHRRDKHRGERRSRSRERHRDRERDYEREKRHR